MRSLGNVMVFGDSYSTYDDYIDKSYESYYRDAGPNYVVNTDKELSDNDVTSVNHTWWKMLVDETNSNLVLNESFSGSAICHCGYENTDGKYKSFITRFERLLDNGFFQKNKIDTILLFGGTNDSWMDAEIGKEQYENWTNEDLYKVLPAFCYLIEKMTKSLKDTEIICIVNSELKEEITEIYKKICKKYGIKAIQLEIVEKSDGHPTKKGMLQIKDTVLNNL